MNLGFLNFYNGVLNVQQQRASLVANNIANADTPGYKAADVPFESALASQIADPGAAQATPLYRADAAVALNGNDVSLDAERIEAAQNGERMIGAATFLKQSTADMITALRPNPSGN
ncbi:MAG: flagellar biosynthesis protein FlgB [Rhodospirillales bacterium 20-64-7]|nr:MAG: flagellar biosynthesis protein FlgB [Rhodospirillales bacterium 20-64-7]